MPTDPRPDPLAKALQDTGIGCEVCGADGGPPADAVVLRERLDAAGYEVRPRPPAGTRLVLASESLLDQWGTRSDDGRKLSAEWGEQHDGGWYEPVFTARDDGMEVRPKLTAERLARAASAIALGYHDLAISGDDHDEDGNLHPAVTWERCTDPKCAALRAALAPSEP